MFGRSRVTINPGSMAIRWEGSSAGAVAKLMRQFPPDSDWCRVLAVRLLEHALRVDAGAMVRKLVPDPSMGVFVVPRAHAPDPPWDHHFAVHVRGHVVDAFTGADGTPQAQYLEDHWQFAEALRWVPASEEELEDVEVEP